MENSTEKYTGKSTNLGLWLNFCRGEPKPFHTEFCFTKGKNLLTHVELSTSFSVFMLFEILHQKYTKAQNTSTMHPTYLPALCDGEIREKNFPSR